MAWVLTVDSVNITTYVDIESILVEEVATQDVARIAVLRFTAHDHTSTISIEAEDAVTLVEGGTTYYAGKVKEIEGWVEGVTRYWRVACADQNVLLEETAIETYTIDADDNDDAEIAAIFAAYRDDVDPSTYVAQLDATMPALILDGHTLREALDVICAQTGGRYYVDFDKNLHYFSDSESNNAAFGLSDSPDGSTTYGYERFHDNISSSRLAKRFWVKGQDVSGWVTGGSYSEGAPEGVYRDNRIETTAARDERGTQLLDRYETAQVTYDLFTRKDGLSAGMDVNVVNAPRSLDSALTIRRIVWRFEDRAGTHRLYHLWLNDEPPDAAARVYTTDQRLATLEQNVTQAGEAVFDDDAPSAPAFEVANLATGVNTHTDGTQLVYVTMTWGSVGDSDLRYYEAQVSTAADFSADVMTRLHPRDGGREETWEGLRGNTTYYFRVRAVDWAGNASSWSTVRSITSSQDSSAPAQVTGLVVAGARSLFGLDWDDNSESDRAYYEIQRDADSEGSPAGSWATVGVARTSHYVDQGFSEAQIQASTAFHYKVRCVDTSGNTGDYSASATDHLDPFGSDSIAANAIIAVKIASGAVETDKLDALAVTTAKLDAGAVTVAKLDVVVGGYNLLINSGINDDDDADGVPDQWVEVSNLAEATPSLNTAVKVVGSSSFKYTVAVGGTEDEYAYIYQTVTLANIPLAVGDDFTLSGYIVTSAMTNLRVWVDVAWYDATPSQVGDISSLTVVTGNQDWTRDTVSGTVPSGTVTGRIRLAVKLSADNGVGNARFDAIKLERGDVATAWTTGMIGNVTIDGNRVQVVDSDAKVWLGKRGASLGMWGEDAAGNLEVGWYASGTNAGAIVAGAGSILLNEGGIQSPPGVDGYDSTRSYKIAESGTTYGYFHGYTIAGYNILEIQAKNIAGRQSNIVLNANAPADKIALAAMQVLHADANHGYVKLTSAASASVANLEMHVQQVWINETANANVTIGLTINQGANDDEIFSLKSSDISHLVTDLTEQDTYLFVKKVGATTGGAMISGFEDIAGSAIGLQLSGYTSTALNTTKTGAGRGAVELRGYLADTSPINATADGNIVALRTYRDGAETTIIIIDEDGDIHHDGTTAAFDEHDDALMAGDLARLMSGQYNKVIEHNREAFEAAGIIGPQDENGRFMVSSKGIMALTLGALGQLWEKCRRYERALRRIDPGLLEEAVAQ